ncbi:MAG: SDR family oxidoreductase [Blastocatellia bacterium]|nr:SDR family oxidoreductase [Blastocatellia bacterium]MBL8197071.1 SDR family oxidoreductase [Blastocatellia bacterium]MBN8722404.1 SDR family oxidoreductase [Acidobacteriota bacterium]
MLNNNQPAILLTGASGFLAGELLPRLLKQYKESIIYILLRAENEIELVSRREKILDFIDIDSKDKNRVVALAGNIEKEDLGLGSEYNTIASQVNEIYHSAANTRFDQPLEKARSINYVGTENILRFAQQVKKLGHLVRYNHVSTAYVAGNRVGIVKETELDCEQSFFNTYEQSKYESEMLLRKAFDELPITVYRPSIIAGDSISGRTPHFYVIYEPMKWIYFGQLTFLPCQPELKLDIVPIDYVCDAIVAIAQQANTVNQTFHLTAGPDKSINMYEMVDSCIREFNDYNKEIGKELIARPEIITPNLIENMEGTMRKRSEQLFHRAWQQIQRHMPYIISEKVFDDSATRKALSNTKISCPAFRDYLPVVVRYALKKEFR